MCPGPEVGEHAVEDHQRVGGLQFELSRATGLFERGADIVERFELG